MRENPRENTTSAPTAASSSAATWTNAAAGRRVTIRREEAAPSPLTSGEQTGEFVELGHSRTAVTARPYGVDEYARRVCAADKAGDLVVTVFIRWDGPYELTTADDGDRLNGGLVASIIVPKNVVEADGEKAIRKRIDDELANAANWMNGEVYVAVLERGTTCSHCNHTAWTQEGANGPYFSLGAACEAAFRDAGIPDDNKARKSAGWV